ncbi:MAG: dihydrofolate reductase family protein [Chitinophagales bacterium]
MPFVALKWAESKDGFIAKHNERTKITNDATKFWTHQLRTKFQGILIGNNTLNIDKAIQSQQHDLLMENHHCDY